jgi:glycerol-3-phosphate acyltransferase PlsY
MYNYLMLCVTGYLVGSVPFGFLLTKLRNKVDIRDVGSHGTGATNVLRISGKGLATLTLLLDLLKGAVFALSVTHLCGMEYAMLPAFFCILGHVYPVWLRFRGGKGVATSAGVLLAVAPIPALIGSIAWALALKLTKVSSICSLVFAFTTLIASVVLSIKGQYEYNIVSFAFSVLCFVVFTHRENIANLFSGKEKRINS